MTLQEFEYVLKELNCAHFIPDKDFYTHIVEPFYNGDIRRKKAFAKFYVKNYLSFREQYEKWESEEDKL